MNQNVSLSHLYKNSLLKNFVKDLILPLALVSLVLFAAKTSEDFLIDNESPELMRLSIMLSALLSALLLNGFLKLNFFYKMGQLNKNHHICSFKYFIKINFTEWVNVEIRVQLRILLTFFISLIPFMCLFLLLSPVGIAEIFNPETTLKAKFFAALCLLIPLAITFIENTRLSLSSLHVFYNEKMKNSSFDPIFESREFLRLKKWKMLLALIFFDILVLLASSFINLAGSFSLTNLTVKATQFILTYSFLTYLYYIFLHTLYVLSSESETALKHD